ncbi:MAG: hypothetical protein AB1560_11825 [Pseudomonadota bacterium]
MVNRGLSPVIPAMRFIFVCFTSILLAACVIPLKKTVYEPVCPMGTALTCTQLDDRLIIELPGGAKIYAYAYLIDVRQKANKTISLCLNLQLEPESTFRLVSTKIILESNSWRTPRAENIKELTEPGPNYYSADDTITSRIDIAQRESVALTKRYLTLWLEIEKGASCETNIPVVTEFTLRMPDVLVNNQKIQIPPVIFTMKKKWVTEGLCC